MAEQIKWKGTPVPNTGHVEKVYFNNNLSKEEVIQRIEPLFNLTSDSEIYLLSVSSDYVDPDPYSDNNELYFKIYKESDRYGEVNYEINHYTSTGSEGIFNTREETGWYRANEIVSVDVNFTVVDQITSSVNGLVYSVGEYNHLISDLFSITPFVIDDTPEQEPKPSKKEIKRIYADAEEIYVKSTVFFTGNAAPEGTPVPFGEYVEKIYFNTNLTNDEINTIIQRAYSEYDMYGGTLYQDELGILFISHSYGRYTIAYCPKEYVDDPDNYTIFFTCNDSNAPLGAWTEEAKQGMVVNRTSYTHDEIDSSGVHPYGASKHNTGYNQIVANIVSLTPLNSTPSVYKEETLEHPVSKEELENAFLKGLFIGVVEEGKVTSYEKPLTLSKGSVEEVEYASVATPVSQMEVYSKEYK